jgi:phospholipase B1
MIVSVILFCYFLCSFGERVDKIDVEVFAQQLLESRIYRGIKTFEDAVFFTHALKNAFENYTYESAPVAPFPCPPTERTVPPPTNARRLKPGDIDLVIGIGDSLTAAFGADATNFFNLFTDYRASSFSIGLSSVMTTLPTSFQVYNPNIAGFSVGSGNANSPNARLNVAESGARSADLPPQVTNLITKLQSYDPSLWKHISLFIGGNDLCDSCTDWATYSPARFQANIQAVIDTIRLQIPNVFLSLIGPPDITLLAELTGGWCGILRPFECSCSKDPGTSDLHPQYMTVLHDIEAHYNSLNIENFFVSVQPFFELIEIPRLGDGKPDMTYFAPDCFHFSAKAHSAAALALWNNLMEAPVDKKRTWVIGEPYECPSPNQYLQ